MKSTAKMFSDLKKEKKKLLAAILKNSPNVRENVRSGHFERKKKKKRASSFPFFEKTGR